MASPVDFDDNVSRRILTVGATAALVPYFVLNSSDFYLERPMEQRWISSKQADFGAINPPGAPNGIKTFNNVEVGPPPARRGGTWNTNKPMYVMQDRAFVSDEEQFVDSLNKKINWRKTLMSQLKTILGMHAKRAWYDRVIREVEGGMYVNKLRNVDIVDIDIDFGNGAEDGFTFNTSFHMINNVFPVELCQQIKCLIVHKDIWNKLYAIAVTTNYAGNDVVWVEKSGEGPKRKLYVHGVPVLMDEIADSESTLDSVDYTFKGLKYVSVPGNPEAEPPVADVYRYRTIVVVKPLIYHQTFLLTPGWMQVAPLEPSQAPAQWADTGRPSGWELFFKQIYLSYLDMPVEGFDSIGMAVLDHSDVVETAL